MGNTEASQKKGAFKRQMAVDWVKKNRPDIHEKIDQLASKKFALQRVRTDKLDLSAELEEVGK